MVKSINAHTDFKSLEITNCCSSSNYHTM